MIPENEGIDAWNGKECGAYKQGYEDALQAIEFKNKQKEYVNRICEIKANEAKNSWTETLDLYQKDFVQKVVKEPKPVDEVKAYVKDKLVNKQDNSRKENMKDIFNYAGGSTVREGSVRADCYKKAGYTDKVYSQKSLGGLDIKAVSEESPTGVQLDNLKDKIKFLEERLSNLEISLDNYLIPQGVTEKGDCCSDPKCASWNSTVARSIFSSSEDVENVTRRIQNIIDRVRY